MALSAGARLGPYEIVAPLGAGGMGEVYKARDPRIGREVAIKVLPAGVARDADRLRRFEQEVQAAGALNHPNILVIHDVGTHGGAPYIVSELLVGETLRERLHQGPIAPRRAAQLALDIAQGLAEAHDKGIVHRDLKPENLFLTRDGRLKILDFGLAKLTHPEQMGDGMAAAAAAATATEPGVVLGTAGYMSPEQVRGQGTGRESDIFSFGAILYEMLSGQRAFRGGTVPETMTAILKEEPPRLSQLRKDIPPALERVVGHCLEKDPQRRFQSARDLAFALDALSGVSAPAAPIATPTPVKGRLRMLAAAAVSLVLFAAGAFVAGERAAKPPAPSFHQLTFRQGFVSAARFSPDGQTVIYGAMWERHPLQLYSTRPEGPESRPFGLPDGDVLSISQSGEMAMSLGRHYRGHISTGTLGQVPLAGAAPREVLEEVQDADWSPDGAGLAVVRRVQGMHRLEFPVGKVLYQTEGWISHARFSPDGGWIAFLDHPFYGDDRGSIAVLDTAGHKRSLAGPFPSVQGVAWPPGGREVWYTASESGSSRALYAVPVSGGAARLVYRMAGTLLLQDIDRDGRVLLDVERMQLRTMCRPAGESAERDLSWFDWSNVRDLSADGKTVLISEQGAAGGPHYAAYVRRTDGSPAVRIGEGFVMSLSPDGKWALSILVHTSPARLVLLPTGPGESRSVSYGSFNYRLASFFPDGKRTLVQANEPGQGVRLYVQDLGGGQPRAITPEGFGRAVISPDGKQVACLNPEEKLFICPVEGGEPYPVAGADAGDVPISFSDTGQFLYVFQFGAMPAKVYRLNLSTGKKEFWKQLEPSDPAGARGVNQVLITPDGRSYAYHYSRFLSELFLVDGLK